MPRRFETWLISAAMDRARPGWRQRAAAQRSPWKVLELGLVFLLFGMLWFFAAPWASAKLHAYFHPNAPEISTPFRAAMSFWTICAIFPIAAFLLPLAGIVVNAVESLFRFTRVRAERGSEQYPDLAIERANTDLARALIWTGAVSLPLYILGSVGPWLPNNLN